MAKKIIIKLKLTVLQGTGLVAKDRNALGQKTTSDPYVEVWTDSEMIAKTCTIWKTLDPAWNETFMLKLSGDAPKVTLKIWDEDRRSDPDAMGIVTIEIPTKKGDTTEWYDVPKNSAQNASGQLQVRLETVRLKKKKGTPKSDKKKPKDPNSPKKTQETDSSKGKTKDETDWPPPLVVHSTELMAPVDAESQKRVACLEEEVEHLQEEVKTLIKEKGKLLNNIQQHTNEILGERISVKLTIMQGTGLVAKDRNYFMGKKTSSDPYVEVYASTSEMISTYIGKTATIDKTVDPIWNERFDLEPRRDNPKVTLKIWDEDYLSEPDAMGVVKIEIPTKPGDTTEWYDIPESSAKNASGKLQVRLETGMVANTKWHIEHLEKEVERLTGELSKTNIAAPMAPGKKKLRNGKSR
jgi:Ca2+-dependent lipid-binding protein